MVDFCKTEKWGLYYHFIFVAMNIGILEVLVPLITILFKNYKKIPMKADHLDELENVDIFYLVVNRFTTVSFVYFLSRFCCSTQIKWDIKEATITNTLLPLPAAYLTYDFFYFIFHWTLHRKQIYGYIHKHHHRQRSPTRGYIDASNVHPLEFVIGEYLHILSLSLMPALHGYSILIFFVLSAFMNSLNHTRFDVHWFFNLYDVKNHDIHHRLPNNNYCIYSRCWDVIFGTFREYNWDKE
ncbi:hypothetical protein MHBO_001804 [Bonamia ostreae]|uniref:Fatty acid hydroxylase domain-containing protein n=1 Tax=Bonamia ostreae TaxID=126728 RepID=A0ABV2AK89_9EUKA